MKVHPQVNYKEALTASVEHTERLKKQSGGSGLFAQMSFELGPADEDFEFLKILNQEKTKLQFVNDIFGGSVPKEYFVSIIKGLTLWWTMVY